MDVGCYTVSGCRTIAGAEPERVYAEQVVGGKGVDVAMVATLRFPGDVLAHLDCGLSYEGGDHLEAVGTEGSIFLDDPWHGKVPVIEVRRADRDAELIELDYTSSYALELDDFAAAVARRARTAARPGRRARPGPRDRSALRLRRKERHHARSPEDLARHLGAGRDGHPLRAGRLPADARRRVDRREGPPRRDRPRRPDGRLRVPLPAGDQPREPRRHPRGARRARHLLRRDRPAPRPPLRQGRPVAPPTTRSARTPCGSPSTPSS